MSYGMVAILKKKNCTYKVIESGSGNFSQDIENNEISRLSDHDKQIDFMLTVDWSGSSSCNNVNLTSHTIYNAMEMPGIKIKITPDRTKRNTQKEVDTTAHLQFIKDRITDQENLLLKNVQNKYCENLRTRQDQAIGTSQFNGWLGAAMLNLPYCKTYPYWNFGIRTGMRNEKNPLHNRNGSVRSKTSVGQLHNID